MPLLDVRHLKTVFETESGTLQAVDDVSFTLESGRSLGLVGESGCGKSVTALSILRLIPSPPGRIAGGEILWKGRDILKIPVNDMPDLRGREIAMIFQDPMTSLNPVFTINKQLGEVLKKRFKLTGAVARKRAVEALDQVGIADPDECIIRYPHELSGGMKQRVMIAMAMLCEPDLLIADEPTTALDVTLQAQILHLLKELQKRTGMAIMLITHDMGIVAELCDEVAVMYAARIVERCGIRELFKSSRHPYTRGLLNSIPRRGISKEHPLASIEGTVPSLIKPPKGCRFAERCPRRQERCNTDDPQLREIEPGRLVACHFPHEDGS